jgi:hypothetical protein
MTTHNTVVTIEYRCDACGKPVRAKDGCIHVSSAAAYNYRRDLADWRKQHVPAGARLVTHTELSTSPRLAKWEVHHFDCDPRPDDNDYWFDVGRADTDEKVLSRTAHLTTKSWFASTNWSQFLYTKVLYGRVK